MDIQKPTESQSSQPSQKDLSILILGVILVLILLLSLSFVLRGRGVANDPVTSQPIPSDSISPSGTTSGNAGEVPSVLDEVPFDSQNPDLDTQIEALEAEVSELELELLEEELSDSQLGIE